MTVLESRKI